MFLISYIAYSANYLACLLITRRTNQVEECNIIRDLWLAITTFVLVLHPCIRVGWLLAINPRLLCIIYYKSATACLFTCIQPLITNLHSFVAAELTVSLEEQVYEVGEVDTNRHLAVLICAQTGGAEIERFSTIFVTLSTGNGTAIGE